MTIRIEIDENRLKELVYADLREKLGSVSFSPADIKIEVRSKQNYRSEWEKAEFRAILSI